MTVATDVYSLGVILFELLTGVSPYSPDGRSLGAYELEVLHVEPPLMSRVARPAEVRDLRGDLDAIVAKALEKKPEDRYASVEAFALDIERHLAAEPIAARPRSFAYVARKFLRRNAWPLSIASAWCCCCAGALGFAVVSGTMPSGRASWPSNGSRIRAPRRNSPPPCSSRTCSPASR